MRITFIEPHLELYGGIRRVMEFANRFVDRGVDVTIYHPTGEQCSWMECRAQTRPTARLFDVDHDVVIFNNPPDYKLARRARARLKVFYILALYDREKLLRFDPKIFWPRKGRMMTLKRCLQLPFVHVANATWMRNWLRDNMGIDAHLQLGGVNRELFRPIDVPRPNDGVFRVLCSGDPREHKGTAIVEQAVERVRKKYPRLTLETYHGRGIPQSEMARTYCAADLFVDAQWYAGWNNPVVEAMACGVPVVCGDIGGVADFAVHERTALLARSRDAGSFARAISRMIDAPELRKLLSGAALTRVRELDWDKTADEFLGFLQKRAQGARS